MKFELKRISYNKRLSEETNAFAADVYVDGKKAGDARNDGHGGETMVHLHFLSPEERKRVNDWIKQQPPKVYPERTAPHDGYKFDSFSMPMSIEIIVDDLLEAHLDEKYGETAQKKKWCKKDLCYRLKGDKAGSYRVIKGKDQTQGGVYTKRLKDHLTKTHGDKIEEILNETLGEMPK